MYRCSKCHKTGHYKNTCRNPRVDFDDDDPRFIVSVEDLLLENLSGSELVAYI